MNKHLTAFRSKFDNLGQTARSFAAKTGAAGTAMLASGAAMAQATSPGGAIAAELATAKTEVMGVIALLAVVVGVLLLWAYVKRAR